MQPPCDPCDRANADAGEAPGAEIRASPTPRRRSYRADPGSIAETPKSGRMASLVNICGSASCVDPMIA